MEIHTHIIDGDYDCLEENIKIAGINTEKGSNEKYVKQSKKEFIDNTTIFIWLRDMYVNHKHMGKGSPISSSSSNW